MFATQTRDLSHIELERSDDISSLSNSESISNSSFVNIFHESEYIDRIKKQEQEKKEISPFTLALSACNKGLGIAHLRLTSQMRCSHFAQSAKLSAKDITL